jgi:hypothetical protein
MMGASDTLEAENDFDPDAYATFLAQFGMEREDLSLLNRVAFVAAANGVVREARTIAHAVKELAPDHASWAITEYLCLLAEGRRDEAIDTLERDGLPRLRAWEQAAQLLLSELDPKIEADRRAPIAARLEAAEISDHRDDPKPHEARE